MIQWLFISGYVLQNMLQVGFGKTFQNLSYFDQSVAYVRVVKETERGTLECQVVEWTARAKTAEEKCKTISKASEEAIGQAREGEKKARQDKNSFVIDLQRKMEIGGIQMYCIERGSV
jgi:predicted HAD superfamily phosphohydrolase